MHGECGQEGRPEDHRGVQSWRFIQQAGHRALANEGPRVLCFWVWGRNRLIRKGSSSSRKAPQGLKVAQRGAANPGKAFLSLNYETAKGYLPQGVKIIILQPYAERRLYQMSYQNENPPRSCSFIYAADSMGGCVETQSSLGCLLAVGVETPHSRRRAAMPLRILGSWVPACPTNSQPYEKRKVSHRSPLHFHSS